MFDSARMAHRVRQVVIAERICRQILELEPRHLPAKALLGLVAGETGRIEMGIGLMQEVVAVDKTSWPAYNALSMMLRAHGEPEAAAEARKRANELQPGDLNGMLDYAACLADARRFMEAAAAFEAVLAVDPRNLSALVGTAECLYRMEKREEAAVFWRRAYDAEPDTAVGKFHLAQALGVDQDTEQAIDALKSALALDPNLVEAYAVLGDFQQRLGLFEEAEQNYRRAIEHRPTWGAPYGSLVRGRRMKDSDRPLVERMIELSEAEDAQPADLLELHYGIGKALDDLKEYGEAMRHFDEGNRLAKALVPAGQAPFDRELCASLTDDVIATYTKEFFAGHQGHGSDSELPLLIVGMMRSGTTLTEQIVSSHPQVGAAGEQLFWMEKGTEVGKNLGADFDFSKLEKWADEYLELLRRFGAGCERVTDKNPHNYIAIGFIHTVFPNARIVHCRRHPIDNCLSIYVTRNASSADFMHDRENITFMYEQYLRVMEHWRSVLPADRFLEISYEELVSDQETVARRMIEFCGLPWDDACLHHEGNVRTVVTPSLWQARQPVYRTSVERWRNYEPWLGPFGRLAGDGRRS